MTEKDIVIKFITNHPFEFLPTSDNNKMYPCGYWTVCEQCVAIDDCSKMSKSYAPHVTLEELLEIKLEYPELFI